MTAHTAGSHEDFPGHDATISDWLVKQGGLRSALTLIGYGWICACTTIVDPALPHAAYQWVPPAVYQRWWAMTESCSGRTDSYSALTWYIVPGASSLPLGNTPDVQAYWSEAGNRIVMIAQDTLDGAGRRHEMLHALLRTGGHPRTQFLGNCAGVVDCAQACVNDAGPPPTLGAAIPEIPPESLEVSADLVQFPTDVPNPAGYFTIAVSVRNPASHSVVAVLAQRAAAGNGRLGFEYRINGTFGGFQAGVVALDPSTWTFAAGETKRQLFDFVIGIDDPGDGEYSPGSYTVRGSYGGHWSLDTPLQIPP